MAKSVVGQHHLERPGSHAADVEGVDPHPRGELGGDIAGHAVECGLGCAVGDEHRLGHAGRARRDVDHRPRSDRVHHLAGSQFGQRQGSSHVEGEGPGHEPLTGVERSSRHGPAGVVDQDVESAELLDGSGHEPLVFGFDGDVGHHDQRSSAPSTHRLGHFLQVGFGPGGQHHIGTGLGQPEGDAPSDPEARTRDDGDPAVEAEPVEDHRSAPVRSDLRGNRMLMWRRPPVRGRVVPVDHEYCHHRWPDS